MDDGLILRARTHTHTHTRTHIYAISMYHSKLGLVRSYLELLCVFPLM